MRGVRQDDGQDMKDQQFRGTQDLYVSYSRRYRGGWREYIVVGGEKGRAEVPAPVPGMCWCGVCQEVMLVPKPGILVGSEWGWNSTKFNRESLHHFTKLGQRQGEGQASKR